MDFGIQCVTVFACYWLLLVFLYLYCVYDMIYVLIIRIGGDVCKWHCLETRNGFYLVDNTRVLVETSVDYYPVAKSGHFGVHLRVLRTTSWPKEHTNQSVTGHQRTTPILK